MTIDYFLFLVDSLRDAASEVVIVSALTEPKYRSAARASFLKRLLLRFAMYVAYPARLAVATLRSRRGDIWVVTSNTFFAPALVAGLVGWRGIKVVHVLYDLFPDAIEVAGRIRRDSLRFRLLGCIASANQSSADGTVYLGEFLRDYTEARWGRSRFAAVIPIATDVRLYDAACPAQVDGPLSLHYGGQLGWMHESDTLAATLQALAARGVLGRSAVFDARISGARAKALEAQLAGLPGTTVGPTLPSDAWRSHAEKCHIGVVTLSPGGATVCLPSKTYAMMAAGLAIIAICPKWSDLARLIESTGAGWIVDNAGSGDPLAETDPVGACRKEKPQGDVARECADLIERLVADRELVLSRRRNAWLAVRDRYSPEQIRDLWMTYLGDSQFTGAAVRQNLPP